MKKYLLLILTLSSFNLFSQTNYQKGLVVLNNGDSVKGFIDYKEWLTTPNSIAFKTNSTDQQITEYDPRAIQYFEVTGFEYYKTFTTPISMGETKVQSLSTGRDTTRIVKTVFFKVLQEGNRLTLFSYKDNIKTRFYVAEGNGPLEELAFSRYLNAKGQIETSSIYRNQLNGKAIKYGLNITTSIARAEYETSSILRIVSQINGIDQKKNNPTVKSSSAPKTRFFVGVGLNASSAKFNGNSILGGNIFNNNPFDGASSDLSIRPKIAFGIDFMMNPNIARSIFRIEVMATQFKNQMYRVEELVGSTSVPRKSDVSYVFTQNTVSMVPHYIYHFYNASSFKFYGGFGVAFNLSTYPNGNVYDKKPQNPAYSYEAAHSDDAYRLANFWISIPLTGGIVINKKYEVSLMYLFPSSISSAERNFALKVSSVQMDFKYVFVKPNKK